jgi:hypothetical protein
MLNQLSQYCNNPSIRHWNALVKILRYLSGTRELCLVLGSSRDHGMQLQGFCDADYARDIDSRVSCSGGL